MSKPSTTSIHHPYVPPATFAAPQPGVFKASTVFFADVAACARATGSTKAGYTYGLHGTPTTFTLEERLATPKAAPNACWCPVAWRPSRWWRSPSSRPATRC